MGKILIVSNRLPVGIEINNNKLKVTPSVGGLATGMKSIHGSSNSKWIGWSGLNESKLSSKNKKQVKEALAKENCIPVYLSKKEIEGFYAGFSNKTIWPLFHYFTEFTDYSHKNWTVYKDVNRKFAEEILINIEDGDKLWIHDYHLLLLPKLIKEKRPDIIIGYFLHIPFPSFEVYRILPWRKELLMGILGADLIGFHTYDYVRHFISSVRRLLGFEVNLNKIHLTDRTLIVDSFPMGIDYERYHKAARKHQTELLKNRTGIRKDIDQKIATSPKLKLILSIDRLDYTKGIANRLRAFEYFLEKYSDYKEKVTLVMLVVPSRSNVEQYKLMKKEVDELVGNINGKFSTISWSPVWYFYRSFPFENLIDLYIASDIALLTPIRDGMNLVAKEFIASKVNQKGVLILSEMAGSAQEMSEALIINPNSYDEIADALNSALLMPESEQVKRIQRMQKRLKRYDVDNWSVDYLRSLDNVKKIQSEYYSKKITTKIKSEIFQIYNRSKKRIIFLDYDGTLVGFKENPDDAIPDEYLLKILDNLASDPNNKIVIISGRDKIFFDKWFKKKKYNLIVEHGIWLKRYGMKWEILENRNTDWKGIINNILETYEDRTPGTFVEEKSYSLVWHYRKADPELGNLRANELKHELRSLLANLDVEVLEGHKIIEVKSSGINKGMAALKFLDNIPYDFILGIGDDWTDEYLFRELPEGSITIKVGMQYSSAKYNIDSPAEVRKLLNDFLKIK